MLEVDPNPGTRVSTPVQKEQGAVLQADQEGSRYSMLEVDPNPGTRVSTPVQKEQGTPGRPGGVQVLNARGGFSEY